MKLRRERGVTFEELPDDDDSPSAGPPPWALAEAVHLERALGRLPALTRSVLWLYHVEEYTHQEIAELTANRSASPNRRFHAAARACAACSNPIRPHPIDRATRRRSRHA